MIFGERRGSASVAKRGKFGLHGRQTNTKKETEKRKLEMDFIGTDLSAMTL